MLLVNGDVYLVFGVVGLVVTVMVISVLVIVVVFIVVFIGVIVVVVVNIVVVIVLVVLIVVVVVVLVVAVIVFVVLVVVLVVIVVVVVISRPYLSFIDVAVESLDFVRGAQLLLALFGDLLQLLPLLEIVANVFFVGDKSLLCKKKIGKNGCSLDFDVYDRKLVD